jgi:hypothetical protein
MYQTLAFLMSNAPKTLFSSFKDKWGSFAKASSAEAKIKKRHIQIRELYERGS